MQIAIDGPSGSGKSTIAKELSKRLNIDYLDTGAMYRTLALFFLNEEFYDYDNDIALNQILNRARLDIRGGKFYLFDEDVTQEIRTDEISQLASKISSYKLVREYLVNQQRDIAKNRSIVMDGRDVGTVILKDADYKFFLTADLEERARRRFLELSESNHITSLEETKEALRKRDFDDSNREISPLKKADDAVTIDSTHKSVDEIIDEILYLIGE